MTGAEGSSPNVDVGRSSGGRAVLVVAALAVAFTAADTYVVVLALQNMVAGVGGDVTQLQRAAPIVSGFLLGYVAVLPLLGRVADLRGRVPVLSGSLVVFAVGSLLTAAAYDLPSLVAGRVLQGVGAGGLIPATLALVADLYPVHRRGVPLGVVSAVQEVGSVVGPLLGALILVVGTWRDIFVVNLVVSLALMAALRVTAKSSRDSTGRPSSVSSLHGSAGALVGWVGLAIAVLAAGLIFAQPHGLRSDLRWGALFVPFADGGPVGLQRWGTPLGLMALTGFGVAVSSSVRRGRPLNLAAWWRVARHADLIGSLWLAVALGGIVLAFATADPTVEVFSAYGRWSLLVAAAAALGFARHQRRATAPLIPRGAFSARPAWGALLVSALVGAALIAALVDVPLFARTTLYPDRPIAGALVLLRFLIAVPIGAIVGGYAVRRMGAGIIVAAAMACSATGFALMARWDAAALETLGATVVLIVTGLGFGVALAPVNASVLAATDPGVHGLAGALTVLARTIGMLVGISALTTLGLRRFYAEQSGLPDLQTVCHGASRCPEFTALLQGAAIAQEQTVFGAAAVIALLAGVAGLLTLGRTE